MAQPMATNKEIECFWNVPVGELSERLHTNPDGLTTAEARARARDYGPNRLRPSKRSDALTLLIAQFKSPLILILLVAVGLSFFFNQSIDALIILSLIHISEPTRLLSISYAVFC